MIVSRVVCTLGFLLASLLFHGQAQRIDALIASYEPSSPEQMGELQRQILANIEEYVDQSVVQQDDIFLLAKDPNRMLSDMYKMVSREVSERGYYLKKPWKGFSSDVMQEILALKQVCLEYSLPNKGDQRYFEIQAQIERIKLLSAVELGLFANDDLMVILGIKSLELDEVKIGELAEAGGLNKKELLNYEMIEFSQATLQLRTFEDGSAIKLKPRSAEDKIATFDLSAEDELSLLASLDGFFSRPLIELRTTSSIPEKIEITFQEGEFILPMLSRAQLEEVADLLLSYQELHIVIKSGFQSVPSALHKRRMRSVKVRLDRLGIPQNRILSEEQAEQKNKPHLIIELGNN